MMANISVNSTQELESAVNTYLLNDYELDFMNNQEAVLKKKRWTTAWILGIVVGFFLFIILGIILLIIRAVMSVDSVQITVIDNNTNELKDNLIQASNSNTKFCTSCGLKILENSEFCPGCGVNLIEEDNISES